MAQTETISVALSTDVMAQVRHAIACGDYTSPSEVVDDVLRAWSEGRAAGPNLEHLQVAWQQALQDKRPGVAPEPVFRRIREMFGVAQDSGS